MKKLLLLSLFLFGCETKTDKQYIDESIEYNKNNIVYIKDRNTNLCYAGMMLTNNIIPYVRLFALVPCSKEVEKLLR